MKRVPSGRLKEQFCSKLDVLLQEADESMLWFEHLEEDCGIPSNNIHSIHEECNELISIFVTIVANTRKR